MKPEVAAVAPTIRKSGLTYYSKKLYNSHVRVIPSESFSKVLKSILIETAGIIHVQMEYRVFGNLTPLYVIILAILLKIKRKKTVFTFHGIITPTSPNPLVYYVFFLPIKVVSRLSEAIIVHSYLMESTLAKYYHASSIMIPHGTDEADVGNQDGGFLLFFGFLRPSKGIDILISAFNIIKTKYNIKVVIAGTIARKNEAREVSKWKLTSGITLMDKFISQDEIKILLQHAFAVILPYTDNYVEVSGVVHDVARYGVPIICSDIPRFSELTNLVNCIKVKPDDIDQLVAAIETLINDRKLYQRLSLNIRNLPISWEEARILHQELYRRIAASEGTSVSNNQLQGMK